MNYYQRSIQAEVRTFISLTNTSKCLYFHYIYDAFSLPQDSFPILYKAVKSDILDKIDHNYDLK